MYSNPDNPIIYTSNLNDPRLKAYNDSLRLYNASRLDALAITKQYGKDVYDFTSPNSYRKYKPYELNTFYVNGKPKYVHNLYKKYWYPNIDSKTSVNLYNLGINSNIEPIGYYPMERFLPHYKKPVQPVIYEDAPQASVEETRKFNKIQGLNAVIPQNKTNLLTPTTQATVKMNSTGTYGLYDKYGTEIRSGFKTKEEAHEYFYGLNTNKLASGIPIKENGGNLNNIVMNKYNSTTLNNSKIPFIKPIFDDNQFKKGINGSGFFPNGGLLNIMPSQFSSNYNNLRLYKQSKYLGFGDVLGEIGMGAASGGLSGAAAGGIGALPGALIGGGIGLIKGLVGESAAKKQKKLEDETQRKADERQNAIHVMQKNMDRQINPQDYTGYDVKSYFNANGGYLFNTPYKNGGLLDGNTLSTNKLIQYGLLKDGGKIYIKPENNRLYAFGGSDAVSLPKQNEVPLDDNASIATNDVGTTEGTHETGENIPVSNESGQTGNYVEPGEVILKTANGNYALSKRLGFADKYMQLLATKALLENNISATNDFTKNETKRNISAIDSKINKLPEEQEALKSKLNLNNEQGKAAWGDLLPNNRTNYSPTYKSFSDLNKNNIVSNLVNLEPNLRAGLDSKINDDMSQPAFTGSATGTTNNRNILSDIGNLFKDNNIKGSQILDYAVPFIDNIGNFFLTKNTPEIPKPHLNTAPVLETRIDDSAQKNTISDTAKAYNKYVDYNVGDVTQRLANRRAMLGESTDKLNLINEATSTGERTARNTNRLYAYQTAVANNALLDAYDTAVAARKAGMLQDYSKNLGNIEENIQELQNRHDLTDYQTKQIFLLTEQYKDTGVWTKALTSGALDSIMKDDTMSKSLYDYYIKTGATDRSNAILNKRKELGFDTSTWTSK